jgi:Ca2+-binding EF-hand superfamily protein
MYFNFIDFNNDNQLSISEIQQSINIIFQLIDYNQDGFISKYEINELKNIIDSLK